MPDEIDPQHYKRLDPEPIDVIEAWELSYSLGAVIKYIARAGHKPGNDHVTDLKKAAWFLDREIRRQERS